MKLEKKIIFLCIILLPSMSWACDICGCGVGGGYIGILPDFSNKIVGLRYRYNTLRTHIGANGAISYLTSDETYQTAEAWAGWNISSKIRVMASVPYAFNQRKSQDSEGNKNGLGDISVNGFYQLLNKRNTVFTNKLLVQTLWIGGGIKLPTGAYNPADKGNGATDANLFQLGTGSLDFTANAMYDIRLQDLGLNLVAGYKMNTANKYAYDYGNKLNVSSQVYYKIKVAKKSNIAPNVGISYETAQQDMDDKYVVDVSGGRLLLGTVGMETVWNKTSIGANWQTPFGQKLANNFVKANNRMMLHLAFVL